MKMGGTDFMHLKAYQVDGRVLRTGSSNFSFSGARRQDNDLILIESADAVAQFVEQFEYMWTRRGSEKFPAPAMR
jgi:phosphatidylserine/phosphatidylglycerophosphate/cardiolipin synthase-like enzyme